MKERLGVNLRLIVGITLVLICLVLPLILDAERHEYLLSVINRIMVLSIVAISLDVILGYGGILSLGQAGLFGIGAYAVSILAFNNYLNGWVQLGLAVVASFVVAFVFGLIALRTKGIYFLMISLALGQLLYYIGVGIEQLGGDDGFTIARSQFSENLSFDDPLLLYYVSCFCFAAVLFFCWRLVSSRFGMVIRGIKDNERRMLALGFNTFRYKVLAFAMAGAASGLAGALFVNLKAFMSPVYLQWIRSGEMAVMVLLGGVGTLVGPILGVAAATGLEAFMPQLLESFNIPGQNWHLVYGALLIIVVLGWRGGLLGLFGAHASQGSSVFTLRRGQARITSDDKARVNAAPIPDSPASVSSATQSPFLLVDSLCKSYKGIKATRDVTFAVETGELHAVIGPNGAGKTTLLAQIAGELPSDSGRILFNGKDISKLPVERRARLGIARTYQITSVFSDFTALQNVAIALQASQAGSTGMWANANRDPALQEPAFQILDRIGLAHRAHVVCGELAHGEQRRLELGMAIASEPRLLLLDEPMAGIGGSESEALVALIGELKKQYTIIMVEHDMDAIFQLADKITVLDHGEVIATDSPARIRSNEQVIKAYLGMESEASC